MKTIAIARACDVLNVNKEKSGLCRRDGCRACPLNHLVLLNGGDHPKPINLLYPFDNERDYDGAFDSRMTFRCAICGKEYNYGFAAKAEEGAKLYLCRNCVFIRPRTLTLGLKRSFGGRFLQGVLRCGVDI
jgi:DNA-directed RNA polymerase subunit RPC12/RpoP